MTLGPEAGRGENGQGQGSSGSSRDSEPPQPTTPSNSRPSSLGPSPRKRGGQSQSPHKDGKGLEVGAWVCFLVCCCN